VCINLKCNERHTYGLNLDLGIEKVVRKKKNKNRAAVVVERTPRPEWSPSPQSTNLRRHRSLYLIYLFNVLLLLIEN
jgi:hypothetical protein